MLLICASIGENSFGNTTGTIFRKELPDGRTAVIERRIRIEHYVPAKVKQHKAWTQAEQKEAPPDVISVSGDYRIEDVALKIRDKNGTDTLVWSRGIRFLIERHGEGLNYKFSAHDVVENGDQFAIIFSVDSTDVEIIAKDKSGKYGIISRNTIFKFTEMKDLKAAKLVWVDDVYAVLSFGPSAEIWRIREKSAVKVYSSTDRPLKNP